MDLKDSIIGCILGGAIGDALGVPYEGSKPPIKIQRRTELIISDDTQLTLATCESISELGAVSPAAIAGRLAVWFKKGRIKGVGASTLKALQELSIGGHWALVGRKGEMGAGNGAAMRTAPLAFCIDPIDPGSRKLLRDICRITHHNDDAYVGALAVVLAIQFAQEGDWPESVCLVKRVADRLPDSAVRDRLRVFAGLGSDATVGQIARQYGSSGYVADSVPLALFAVRRLRILGFVGVIEELISCGGDTDTNASIAGQVMGSFLGGSQLPEEMVSYLVNLEEILETAEAFANAVVRLKQRESAPVTEQN
jgi:ADP-ribosyl-[dinitrogen reductase] hydrolase